MVAHAGGKHAGRKKECAHSLDACKEMHTHMQIHSITNTHRHRPEVVHDGEVIKEAQRSVKLKSETNPGSKPDRETASPHPALGVCLSVFSECVGVTQIRF